MKTFLWIVAVILLLLVGAVVALPFFVNLNDHKATIADSIENVTGREIVIGGDIGLSILPRPRLTVADLRIADDSGAGTAGMARVKSLDVQVALRPLFAGDIKVEQITLLEPVVELIREADGSHNWDFRGGEGKDAAGFNIAVSALRIEKGTVVYHDRRREAVWRIEDIDAALEAQSPDGPFEAAASLTARGTPVSVSLSAGRLAAGNGSTPVRLAVDLAGGRAAFNGVIGLGARPVARGRLELQASDLAQFIGALERFTATEIAPPRLAGIAGILTTEIASAEDEIAFNQINLTIGDVSASGDLKLFLAGPVPRLTGALRTRRIDLDALLSAGGPNPDRPPARAPEEVASAGRTMVPVDLQAQITLDANAVTWRHRIVRQVQVNLGLAAGVLTIDRAAALLPGGSDFTLTGRVTSDRERGGQPAFTGAVEVGSDNLQALLAWLGVELSGVAPDRLRKFRLSAALRADEKLLRINRADLRVDATRITGGIAYALRARPSFSLNLSIDRLNLDTYLPDPGALFVGEEDGSVPILAALGRFDTNAKLHIEDMTAGGLAVRGLQMDLTLFDGDLTLRTLRAEDIAGLSASVSGTVADIAQEPKLDLLGDAAAHDLDEFARLGGFLLPQSIRGLDVVEVAGTIRGDGKSIAVQLDGRLDTSSLQLSGILETPLGDPSYKFNVALADQRVGRLAALAGLRLTPLAGADAEASFAAELAGTLRTVEFDALTKVGAGEAALIGRVSEGENEIAYQGNLAASHPDLVALAGLVGLDYQRATDDIGGVAVKARLAGTADFVEAEAITFGVGSEELTGAARLSLDGPRPYLKGDFKAGAVVIDSFLPVAVGATEGQDQKARRWSDAPLDLSALEVIDAELTLALAGLATGGYRLAEPDIQLTLTDGVLDVSRLKGRLFDGVLDVTGELRNRPVPALRLNVGLTGADLGQVSRTVAGLEDVQGLIDLRGTFAAAGRSQADLVRRLNGTVNIGGGDGVIAGVDLSRLGAQLEDLTTAADYRGVLAAAFSEGETRIERIDGLWRVENGIVRTEDTIVELDGGLARLGGIVDLPRWLMEMTAQIKLAEPDRIPAFAVLFRGPIDEPGRHFQTDALERYLADRLGAPDDADEPQPTPAADEPADPADAAIRPGDVLRGLIQPPSD